MIDKMIEEMKEKMVLEFEQEVAEILDLFSDVTIADFNIKTIEKRLCKKVFDEIAEKYKAQEQRWISVDEALPENDGEYLCVYKSALSECNRYEILSFTTDAFRIDNYDFSRYKNKKKSLFYGYDSECGYYEWDKVIAWQPIPEYHIVEAKKKVGGAE